MLVEVFVFGLWFCVLIGFCGLIFWFGFSVRLLVFILVYDWQLVLCCLVGGVCGCVYMFCVFVFLVTLLFVSMSLVSAVFGFIFGLLFTWYFCGLGVFRFGVLDLWLFCICSFRFCVLGWLVWCLFLVVGIPVCLICFAGFVLCFVGFLCAIVVVFGFGARFVWLFV